MSSSAIAHDDDVHASGLACEPRLGRATRASLCLGLVTLLWGCDQGEPRPTADGVADPTMADGDTPEPVVPDDGDDDSDGSDDPAQSEPAPLDAEQVRFYLTRLAPSLVSRSLDYTENQLIDLAGEAALQPILDGWTAEVGFGEAIRFMVQDQLGVSGEKDGVDFELPGNLAAEIANEDLPWSTLLTADYCVAADGKHIACDTGAPYESGVLATRAYLITNKGRFNLSRAKRMLETFACRVYPMETEIQVPLDKAVLIPVFQAETPDEQTVDAAKGGFGNGGACYGCHSQFGAHAQLFVRFDEYGMWQATATGLQDTTSATPELGRSLNGLYASHMNDPAAASAEISQMFGQPVENLRDAADVLTDSPLFQSCTVKNLVARVFDLPSGASTAIEAELVDEIAMRVTADASDPTIRAYVMEVFTDRRVIDAVLDNMEGQ